MTGRFDESNHRRASDGKFASKPTLAASPASAAAAHAAANPDNHRLPPPGETLHEARLDGIVLDRTVLGGDYAFCSFKRASFRRTDLTGKHVGNDFTGADLTGARIGSSVGNTYRDAALNDLYSFRSVHQDADLAGADLDNSTWVSCSFWGADLSSSRGIENATFHDCTYDETTTFPEGYDPASNGWTRRNPPDGYAEAVTRARGAGKTGDLNVV